MFGDKRVEKKKTVIYKCNLNPIFNATFEFDVPWEQARFNLSISQSLILGILLFKMLNNLYF